MCFSPVRAILSIIELLRGVTSRKVLRDRPQTPYQRFASSYPEFVAELRDLKTERRAALLRLASMPRDKQRGEVRRLLRSNRFHLAYAYDAARRVGWIGRATPDRLRELAARCNPFVPVRDEAVVTREVDKGSGRRLVQDFGPRRRMHQALVADLLRHIHPLRRTQTLFNGGMPAARTAVATAFAQGWTHGVEVDFVNFYGSLQFEALAGLLRPLPATVVEHTVWDMAMRDDPRLHVTERSVLDPTFSAPTGLSLGAATSPIVGELIVARLLAAAQLPDTITYADNLFVLGRSEEEVATRIHQIREGIASLDVGRLELRVGFSLRHDLTRPFEFVKQQGQATRNGMTWQPAASKIAQYQISTVEHRVTGEQLATAERRIRFWRRSYSDWRDGDVLEAEYLAGLAARRYYGNRNTSNLSAAVHAVIVAHMATGGLRHPSEFVPTEGDPRSEARARLMQEIADWIDRAEERMAEGNA